MTPPPAPDWFHPVPRKSRDTWTRRHDAALLAARDYDLDVDAVAAAMPEAYQMLASQHGITEPARIAAVTLTGLNEWCGEFKPIKPPSEEIE